MIPKGFPNRATLEFLHCTLITSNVTDYKKAGILPVARADLTLYNNRERQIRDKRSSVPGQERANQLQALEVN